MGVYKYAGRNEKGKMKRGTITSDSRNEAIVALRDRGISLRELEETKETIFNRDVGAKSGGRVKNKHFVIYCRQFATLIRAGVPIVEATNILANQSESKGLRIVLKKVESDIRSGQSFSSAASKYPKAFPTLFISMIRASEMTGDIDITLERLADYFEKQYTLKKKIQSTMIYPVVLIILIIAAVVIMLTYIVPSFTHMFDQFGTDLPAITKFTVAISDLLITYWWVVLIIVIGIIVLFTFTFKNNKAFHYSVHMFLLKMPIFGQLLQKAAIARMTRTLASLFASSVPILNALGIVNKVVNNPVVGKIIMDAHTNLERGGTLSQPLKESWVFPPFVTQMTTIGEETGSLDFMLEKIADFYEEEVDRTVDSLKSLIEPIMIIILAVCVGLVVMSIIFPMFKIFEDIN